MLGLLPAEEDDVRELHRLDEGRIAKHGAVVLEADPHLLVNRCSDQSGREIDHTHVVLRLRHVQAFAQGAHGVFAGVINGSSRSRLAIADRTDVDDRSAATFPHSGQNEVNAIHHPFDHGVHLLIDLLKAEAVQPTDVQHPRIVDQAACGSMLTFR